MPTVVPYGGAAHERQTLSLLAEAAEPASSPAANRNRVDMGSPSALLTSRE
jgi:hypothetical protein